MAATSKEDHVGGTPLPVPAYAVARQVRIFSYGLGMVGNTGDLVLGGVHGLGDQPADVVVT
jgi:hypothetical protein